MHRITTLVVATLVSASAVAADGIFDNGICWNRQSIPVSFETDLDPMLENPNQVTPPTPSAGDAQSRQRAFADAVDAWNRALAAVGSRKRLAIAKRPPRPWAAEQLVPVCLDPTPKMPVYVADSTRTSPDKENAASTAFPSRSKGAGWVVGKETVETYAVCGRLAEAKLVPPPTDGTALHVVEADVLWFTHLRDGRESCKAIAWDYRNAPMVAPNYYDFYTVMVHELGHALGLDHQDCAEEGPGKKWIPNVMAAKLQAGARGGIHRCELKALDKLYGAGGRCTDGTP